MGPARRSFARCVALAVVVAGALWVAAPASAAYYIARPVAEHYTRELLHDTYGYSQTGVACRPRQGRNETYTLRSGRVLYHVWLCGFYASNYGDACKGAITIWGSDGSGGFRYYRHWSRGSGC